MCVHSPLFAILHLFMVLASTHQICYWPDGSLLTPPQGAYINCFNDRPSHFCLNGDACLSNGLCFTSVYGWVCQLRMDLQDIQRTWHLLRIERRYIENPVLLKIGAIQRLVLLCDVMIVCFLFYYDTGRRVSTS